ncbi:MAG TPA: 50S ribosomal protein L4, partial [Bacteroidia bacterium]|nr:50S ribosomal protein L4 [Bacteroidia bacterium]
MELTVKNIKGADTAEKINLPDSIFGIEPNDHAIYQDVRLILANARQGTHKAKERGEVSGSTKKPFRQKGTGGARQGHKRAPHMYHGGRVFGPRPHLYGFKLNRKVKRLARRSALSYKAKDARIMVLENLNFNTPKTKEFVQVLNNLKLTGSKVLMVLPDENSNVYLSGRNIPKTQIVRAQDLNTYDILHADH